MTVSSEILLSTTYTAATGSGRDGASIGKARSHASDDGSTEKASTDFREVLAQTTDTQITDNQAPESQKSNSSVTATTPEDINVNAVPVQVDPQETVPEIIHTDSEDAVAGNIISQNVLASDQSPTALSGDEEAEVAEAAVIPDTAKNQVPQNTEPLPEQKQSQTNIAAIPQTGPEAAQGGNQANKSQAVAPQPTEMPYGKSPEHIVQVQNAPANSNAKSTNSAMATREITDGQHVQKIVHENLVQADKPVSSGLPNSQSDNTKAQKEILPTSVASNADATNISTDLGDVNNAPSQMPEGQDIAKTEMAADQNILAQVDANHADVNVTDMNKAANPLVPLEVAVADVNNTDTQDAPLNIAPLPVAPNQQAVAESGTAEQQIAATSATPAPLKEAENKKSLKESGKDSGKENTVAAANEKNQATRSDTAKTSSQNSSEDKTSAAATQSKASATTPEQLRPAKIPFLTELGQTAAGTEGKPVGPGTIQLPTGLLSVQEVSPNSLQANGMTTANQVKPALPHVTPEMITKQISMAISKQAGKDQNSFKITLKPAHLGQVDIKMDFEADGKVIATVTVENQRTLTLMQKDQNALQKALENAGFEAGGNNLNFSLKKQQQNQEYPQFTNNNTQDGESDDILSLPHNIVSHQQMRMAYSDNLLDINI